MEAHQMHIADDEIVIRPGILKSPLFAIWNGEPAAVKARCEFQFYLPTQLLNGKNLIVAPGVVSIRMEEGKIYIVRAIGGLEKIVHPIVEAGVGIPVESIRRESSVLDKINGCQEKLAVVSSSIVRRGLAYVDEVSKELREFEVLEDLATISARELLEGKIGRVHIRFEARTNRSTGEEQPAWIDRRTGNKYRRLGVVVERFSNGEIAVIACLKENEELIGEKCRSGKSPGENFSNLDYPLAGFLRKLEKDVLSSALRRTKRGSVAGPELDFAREMLESAGEVFEADEWEPLDADRRTCIQTTYVSVVAADEKSRSLLLVHKYSDGKPSWGLVGGSKKDGETVEEALLREVRDRSGLILRKYAVSGKLVGARVIECRMSLRHKRIIFYCPVKKAKFRPHIKERTEIDRVNFFAATAFAKMPYYPWDKSKIDPGERNYKKQLHFDRMITVLRILGKLERFGFHEASVDDYAAFLI